MLILPQEKACLQTLAAGCADGSRNPSAIDLRHLVRDGTVGSDAAIMTADQPASTHLARRCQALALLAKPFAISLTTRPRTR